MGECILARTSSAMGEKADWDKDIVASVEQNTTTTNLSFKVSFSFDSFPTADKRYIFETVFVTENGYTGILHGNIYMRTGRDYVDWGEACAFCVPPSGAYNASKFSSVSAGSTVTSGEMVSAVYTLSSFSSNLQEIKHIRVYSF